MKERPIIFSGPMVRAILDGRKTQTRRVLRPQPREDAGRIIGAVMPEMRDEPGIYRTWLDRSAEGKTRSEHDYNPQVWRCPFGQPGDRLWVRESFMTSNLFMHPWTEYRATYDGLVALKWRPSIHMPRSACRLMLEIVDIKIHRIIAITEKECEAEGAPLERHPSEGPDDASHYLGFCNLWDRLNAKRGYSMDANPWVWAITFRKLEGGSGC